LCREVTEECKESEKCFIGTNKSSTFVGPKDNASLLQLSFGSGDIMGVAATDVVSVGKVSVKMVGGLLLMVKRELDMTQDFEGILGLGVPSWAEKGDSETIGKKWNATFELPRFLEVAGIDMFTVCFRADTDGALRLNPPAMDGMLKQVGRHHWSLSLEGLSIGNSSAPVSACNPASKPADSVSPCAAIPDSGTTNILGPQKDIEQIFVDMCARWPRCQNFESEGNEFSKFEQVLYACQDWATEEHSLNEIPSLFVHLKAADGKTQVLELTGKSLVYGTANMDGRVACFPSLSAFDFPTKSHGPAWILGTPLFYEYQVGFGLQPPSLGFSKEPCQLCDEQAPPLLMNTTLGHSFHRPRIVYGKPRLPDIDITQGL
jgi:hypothetical protein